MRFCSRAIRAIRPAAPPSGSEDASGRLSPARGILLSAVLGLLFWVLAFFLI